MKKGLYPALLTHAKTHGMCIERLVLIPFSCVSWLDTLRLQAQNVILPETRKHSDFLAHFVDFVAAPLARCLSEAFDPITEIRRINVENRDTIEQILEYTEKPINLNRDNVWASWKTAQIAYLCGEFGDEKLEEYFIKLGNLAMTLPKANPAIRISILLHRVIIYRYRQDHRSAIKLANHIIQLPLDEVPPGLIHSAKQEQIEEMKERTCAAVLILQGELPGANQLENKEAEAVVIARLEDRDGLSNEDHSTFNSFATMSPSGSFIRILLKAMIRTERSDETRKIATDFIEKHPCNEWSPKLAVELSRIEKQEGDSIELEIWVKYFEDRGCNSNAYTFQEVRYALFRAYMSEWGETEQCIAIGTKILELMNESDDNKINDDNWPLAKLFKQRVADIADEIEVQKNFLQKQQDNVKRRMQEIEEKKIADKRRSRLRIIGLTKINIIPIVLFLLVLIKKQ